MGLALLLIVAISVGAGMLLGTLIRFLFFSKETLQKQCNTRDANFILFLQAGYILLGIKLSGNAFPSSLSSGNWFHWMFTIGLIVGFFFSIKPIYILLFKNSKNQKDSPS